MSCGGDVVGTWSFVNLCLPVTSVQIEELFALESCDAATGTFAYAGEQTITFEADGSYSSSVRGDGITTVIVDVPKSCASGGNCASLPAQPDDQLTGTWTDEGTGCHYVGTDPGSVDQAGAGPYSTQGNQLVRGLEGSTESWTTDYCVTGDTMSWRDTTDDGRVGYTSLARVR